MSLRQGASSRIKIQWIEFLCDKTGGAQIGEMAEGSQICDFTTGGAQIGQMAEGSQICDFREAKVEERP